VFIAAEARTPPDRLALLQSRIQTAASEVSQNLLGPQNNGAAAIGIMPSRPRRLKTPAGASPARRKA